jgi:transcriptional regulator with XRE-family HTH domain
MTRNEIRNPDSLSARALSPDERRIVLEVIQAMLLEGRLTVGQALRVLRARHLEVTRRAYAKRVGLSYSALTKLEEDEGNPTLGSIEQAFRPFGLRVGLVPVAGSAVRLTAPPLDPSHYASLAAHIVAVVDKRASREVLPGSSSAGRLRRNRRPPPQRAPA